MEKLQRPTKTHPPIVDALTMYEYQSKMMEQLSWLSLALLLRNWVQAKKKEVPD